MSEQTQETVIELKPESEPQPEKQEEKQEVQKEIQVVPAKPVADLTSEERDILLNNAKEGIDNPNFNVKIFKNGNIRITKKKQATISQQAVASNGERMLAHTERKVYMTDNQLIWEHLMELENKYATLLRKHKKLKARYNDLYIEDENEAPSPQVEKVEAPTVIPQQQPAPPQQQQQQQPQQMQPQPQPRRGNWRSMLMHT